MLCVLPHLPSPPMSTHVHPPAARDLAPRHPSILDPTPQKSLTQSNPRSWNLRRRAGRWDRSVRALIRRVPRACSQAFWKRRWRSLAYAAPSLKAASLLALRQGSAAATFSPQESVESVAREGRGSPPRRHKPSPSSAASPEAKSRWTPRPAPGTLAP